MRFAFGLVGLLVTMGIIAMMMSMQTDVLKKGGPADKAHHQAEQISGVGAKESVTMEPVESGGKVSAIQIKTLVAGGPIEKYFGLMPGDQVVEVAQQKVRDMNDPELAEALILESYQRSQQIVVERNGQKITLPATGGNSSGVVGGNPMKTLQGIATH